MKEPLTDGTGKEVLLRQYHYYMLYAQVQACRPATVNYKARHTLVCDVRKKEDRQMIVILKARKRAGELQSQA